MDKELAQLQKEVIKRLIEYEDELQALGDVNQLKKTRRVSSSVAINISAFPDLVQSLLDSGVETAEISRKLRNFQEALLRDTVVIKGTETGHHGSQLRTGGSFYRADPKIWQGSVSRLADFFGTQFGDVPENIKSYINYVHKQDTNTKGIEAALLGKVANPYKELTAHPMGTGPKSIIGDLTPEELSDPDKFFDAMSKRIDVQLEANKVADELQRPLVKTIQENIDPRAYRAPDVPTNLEIQKKVLLPENRQIIEQGILEVVQEAGNVRMRRRQMTALAGLGKGASKLIPGSLDDAIIGVVLATGAAGATLLTGGSPAQAGEAFLETGVDVATGDLQGGNLADATLQTNLDKVKKTLYQEPVNIAAPTGVTTFDAVAQPLIKGLAGQPMGFKRNKGSIVFGF